MTKNTSNPFNEWIRLEQPRLGTEVVYATDDFFAPKERLIDPEDPVWIEGKYDDNGKWMDGWESRRKRVEGYDYCIVKLGIPGIIHGFDVDTSFFTGNYPPAASIDVCTSEADIPGEDAGWRELLPQADLNGDANNYFPVDSEAAVTHLRLNIYPDGGVARLRIYGEVQPDPSQHETGNAIDLLSMKNGGRALLASDEHYGSMHNLNLPDQGTHMGDGWETARRRGPGYDWVVFELGQPGTIEKVQIDTSFYKGNFPDRAEIRAAMVGDIGNLENESADWPVLLPESKLKMDSILEFTSELQDVGVVSHVRLHSVPDGGVMRLRIIGKPDA
jgi:allantoicase